MSWASNKLLGILEDLKQIRPGTAFKLFESNHGYLAIATNTESKRVKHIDMKRDRETDGISAAVRSKKRIMNESIDMKKHFLRDHVARGQLQIETIGTANQIAETFFTKALESGRFLDLYKQ